MLSMKAASKGVASAEGIVAAAAGSVRMRDADAPHTTPAMKLLSSPERLAIDATVSKCRDQQSWVRSHSAHWPAQYAQASGNLP
jgi:hypothetical protein